MPSSNSFNLQPNFLSSLHVVAILSVSLTLACLTPVILVVPSARAAKIATVINKSGAFDKSTSIPFKLPSDEIST